MSRIVLVIPAVILAFAVMIGGTGLTRVVAQEATPAACPLTSAEENEAIALRWHDDVVNGHDLDVIDEIVAPDIVHHAGTFPDGHGPDAVKAVLGALIAAFPDARQTVEQVISDGDFVVTIWRAEGTHEGEFQGYAATGKWLSWTGINIYRFGCGRIVEEWAEVDGLGRLQQMGVLATPTP